MLDRDRIRALIPHAGAMCLLEAARHWSASRIVCSARSHLEADNPLRRDGRLAAIMGVEYGMQAAALHGAVTAGEVAQPRGYLAAVRDVTLQVERLDDAAHGVLTVAADMLHADAAGLLYAFRISAESGRELVAGRATVMLRG